MNFLCTELALTKSKISVSNTRKIKGLHASTYCYVGQTSDKLLSSKPFRVFI